MDALRARHIELMGVLSDGIRSTCVSLWFIREERTYTAAGFKSFGDFVKSLHYSLHTGRLWANIGPLILELRKTGDEELISHPDIARPIAMLLSPTKQTQEVQQRVIRRQAEIVRRAAAAARKGMEPFTEQVVERVARLNYGIKSREEYRADKRAQREAEERKHPDEIQLAKRRRERLELAFSTICDYEEELRRSAEELAGVRGIGEFERVLYLLLDARDA